MARIEGPAGEDEVVKCGAVLVLEERTLEAGLLGHGKAMSKRDVKQWAAALSRITRGDA